MKISDINEATKTSFHGNFGKVVLAMLVYLAFFAVIEVLHVASSVHPFFNFLIAICVIVITVPIGFGLTAMIVNIKDGKTITPFDFFTLGFSNFGRAWKVAGALLVKMLAPMLLLITSFFILGFGIGLTVGSAYIPNPVEISYSSPTYSVEYTPDVAYTPTKKVDTYKKKYKPTDIDYTLLGKTNTSVTSSFQSGLAAGGIVLIVVGTIGSIACTIWLMIVSFTYALGTIIAIKEEDLSSWDALAKSKKLTKGHKGKIFVLSLPIGICAGIASRFMSTVSMTGLNTNLTIMSAINILAGIAFYAVLILILAPIFQMQLINLCYISNNELNPIKESKKKAVEVKSKTKATNTKAVKPATKKATATKKTTAKKTTKK